MHRNKTSIHILLNFSGHNLMWDQILQFLHSTGAYIDTDKGFVVVVVVVVVKNYRFVQMLNFDLSSSYRLGVHSSVYSIICYI